MDIRKELLMAGPCLKAKLFGLRRPIFLSWAITQRCNLRCKYCSAWLNQASELSTTQVLPVIKACFKMGTRVIRFTGGEPLLREDIADIINYAWGLGMLTMLSTNGILFPEKINAIKKLDSVSISLDGPEDIHDSIRGPGSYQKAVQAVKAAKNKGITVSLASTLSSLNLNYAEALLKLAKQFKARVYFQPALKTCLFEMQPNPIAPDPDKYKQVIFRLIKLKSSDKFIGNSLAGLRHLSHWPEKRQINCLAGKMMYWLDSQGRVHPCGRSPIKNNTPGVNEISVKQSLEQTISPSCGNCWCSSSVELNLASAINLNVIFNMLRW